MVSGIASRIASGLLRRVAWEAGLLVSHLAVGRDEGDDGNDAGLVEERRHLGGAPHALAAVLRREAQVAREARAQVVAVDVVDVLAVCEEQLLLQRLAGVITR